MPPPIFDSGKPFKIVSVEYPNQAADLIFANPFGPVSGCHVNNSNNQNWNFNITNNGGNTSVNIHNRSTGTYAFAYAELEGIPISGNAQVYTWTLVEVAPDVYQIATADKAYVWVLENGADYFSILLKDANGHKGPEAQWTFVLA